MSANKPRYREMSVPFDTDEKAVEAYEAFFKDLEEIRIKHRIKDVYCMCQIAVAVEDGEADSIVTMHFGNELNRYPLAAYAFGSEKEKYEKLIQSCLARNLRKK